MPRESGASSKRRRLSSSLNRRCFLDRPLSRTMTIIVTYAVTCGTAGPGFPPAFAGVHRGYKLREAGGGGDRKRECLQADVQRVVQGRAHRIAAGGRGVGEI